MMGTVVSGVVTRRDLVSQKMPKSGLTWSAPEGIRTPNLLIRSQMLYPLSYGRLVYVVVWRRREDLNLRSPLRGTTH